MIQFNDIKSTFNFLVDEIGYVIRDGETKTSPTICLVEDEVYFDIYKDTDLFIVTVSNPLILSVRKKNHDTVLCMDVDNVELKVFEDFITIFERNRFTVYVINNYNEDDKDFLKLLMLKGL